MNDRVRLRWAEVAAGDDRRAVAWQLIREVIGDDDSIRLSNECPRCGGAHGPVRVDGAPYTAAVTYASSLAIVAVAPSSLGQVGVDAEAEVDQNRDRAGLRGILGPGTKPTLREWTRIEAALKADQRGLRVDPGSVTVTTGPDGWRAVVPGCSEPIRGWDPAGPPGVVVSVALRG